MDYEKKEKLAISRQQVVIQLTGMENNDEGTTKLSHRQPPTTTKSIDPDILVMNKNTLQLSLRNFPNCEMTFDRVGGAADAQAEVSRLMEILFAEKHNCCLLRFSALREYHPIFLSQLFVTEVDKQLKKIKCKIRNITLEYMDLRKYDVVNMLDNLKTGSNRSRGKENMKNSNNMQTQPKFCSTLELLKWLQQKYNTLFDAGYGHECFDLYYQFYDCRHRTYKVKFSLMQLYIDKMDSDTRCTLYDYFVHVNDRRQMKRSALTDCLQEYFRNNEDWENLLLFNVPVAKGNALTIDNMLKLASAAYSGIRNIKNSHINLADGYSESVSFDSNIFLNRMSSRESKVSSIQARSFNSSFPAQPVPKPRLVSLTDTFSTLSRWYAKIDERFSSLVTAMQDYYNHKYGNKIESMCGDIRQMMRTFEFDDPKRKMQTMQLIKSDTMEKYYSIYQKELAAFRQLVSDIERMSSDESVRIYLQMKNHELSQHTLRYKIKQLESCHYRISDTIKDEVDSLNKLQKHTRLLNVTSNNSKC